MEINKLIDYLKLAKDLKTLKKIKAIKAIHIHPNFYIDLRTEFEIFGDANRDQFILFGDETILLKLNNLCSGIFIEVEK